MSSQKAIFKQVLKNIKSLFSDCLQAGKTNVKKNKLYLCEISVEKLNNKFTILSNDNFKKYFQQQIEFNMEIQFIEGNNCLKVNIRIFKECGSQIQKNFFIQEILRLNNGISLSNIHPLLNVKGFLKESCFEIQCNSELHLEIMRTTQTPKNEQGMKTLKIMIAMNNSIMKISQQISRILLLKYLSLFAPQNYLEYLPLNKEIPRSHRYQLKEFIKRFMKAEIQSKTSLIYHLFDCKQVEEKVVFSQICQKKLENKEERKYYKQIQSLSTPQKIKATVNDGVCIQAHKKAIVTVAMTYHKETEDSLSLPTKQEYFDLIIKSSKNQSQILQNKRENYIRRRFLSKGLNLILVFIPRQDSDNFDSNISRVVTQMSGENLQKKINNLLDYSCQLYLQFLPKALYKAIRGLRSIHQQGIVHRDVKFLNIVWNEQKSELKIIDFGISTTKEEKEEREEQEQQSMENIQQEKQKQQKKEKKKLERQQEEAKDLMQNGVVEEKVKKIFQRDKIDFVKYGKDPQYDIWRLFQALPDDKTWSNFEGQKEFRTNYPLVIKAIRSLIIANQQIGKTIKSREIEKILILILQEIKFIHNCSEAPI